MPDVRSDHASARFLGPIPLAESLHFQRLVDQGAVVRGPDVLAELFRHISASGRRIVGPRLEHASIGWGPLASVDDLPKGWTTVDTPGRSRLEPRDDGAYFGFAVGTQSLKATFHPPLQELFRTHPAHSRLPIVDQPNSSVEPSEPTALLGVRSCDLHALASLDQALGVDPGYGSRRKDAFVVAVQCHAPSEVCFCASMGTGPDVHTPYDLLLIELLGGTGHRFLIRAGSPAGEAILDALHGTPAQPEDWKEADAQLEASRALMTRKVETEGLPVQLQQSMEHAAWSRVADRCLACGNCTMVCPTCFCSTLERNAPVTSDDEVWRLLWDSCFHPDFAYIHGGSLRGTVQARYRQWLMHKFSYWVQQFGTFGCVGCGRCIAWCPVGIDVTEEIRALTAPPPHEGQAR